jgi:hypothetical protein
MIERLKPDQYWTARGVPQETAAKVEEEREPVVVVRESELDALENESTALRNLVKWATADEDRTIQVFPIADGNLIKVWLADDHQHAAFGSDRPHIAIREALYLWEDNAE